MLENTTCYEMGKQTPEANKKLYCMLFGVG